MPVADAVYTVSEIDLNDARDVTDLFRLWDAVYPGVLERKFDWLYRNGPAGSARVWMIRAPDGFVAGSAAVFPRQLRVEGLPRLAGLAGDFLIHPAHRVLGPAMTLQRRICAEATNHWVEFLYGFPNLTAEPMFLRAGFTPLTERMRWVMPIHSAAIFGAMPGGKKWAAVVAPIADQTLRFRRWLNSRTPGVIYRESTDVDERFGQLWDRIGRGARVAIDRSAAYLRWRYLDTPLTPSTILEALNRRGELIGYGVGRIVDDSAEICELVTDIPAVRRGLASALWLWGRKRGACRLDTSSAKTRFLPRCCHKLVSSNVSTHTVHSSSYRVAPRITRC